MPGGLGTLDELTEVLTLMQTHKIKPFPVILFNGVYWKGFLEWLKNITLAKGYISEEDLHLLMVCDDTEEVVEGQGNGGVSIGHLLFRQLNIHPD